MIYTCVCTYDNNIIYIVRRVRRKQNKKKSPYRIILCEIQLYEIHNIIIRIFFMRSGSANFLSRYIIYNISTFYFIHFHMTRKNIL